MFRLISILLLLAGLGIAALGAMRMTGAELPVHVIRGEPAPPPSPVAPVPAETPPAPAPVMAEAPPPVATIEAMPEPVLESAPEPVLEAAPEPMMERRMDAPAPGEKDTSTQRTVTRSLGSAPEPELPDAPAPAAPPVEAVAAPEPIAQPETAAMRVAAPEPKPSLMDQLRTVPIAHETPTQATFGRPFAVTMAINSVEDAETATDALPGTGNVVEAEAKVSDTVRAIVAGEAFTVEAVSPETQKLSPLTENVWRWSVTPLKAGPQELVIEIYAVDEGEALPVRTFRDTVTVEVSRLGQAIAMAQEANPLIMVLAGIGSIFAGLFGAARFFRGR